MILKQKHDTNPISFQRETFFEDETSNQYRRIAGGLDWPCRSKPGFLAVVAETRRDDPVLKRPHLQVLDVHEDFMPDQLLIRAREFTVKYLVDVIYTDLTNALMMDLLATKNFTLPITPAPYTGETGAFRQYVTILTQLLTPSRTAPFFGGHKEIVAHLQEMRQDQVRGATIEEFPAIAALGYVVSALYLYPYDPHEQSRVNDETFLIGMGQTG